MEPHEGTHKMPCDFNAIRSDPFDLPTEGDIDVSLEFPAPGVNAARRAILMYRARVSGGGLAGLFGALLEATLNGEVIFEHRHFNRGDQSFHKIIDSGIVQSANNTLTLIGKPPAATIRLSDLVLVYGL